MGVKMADAKREVSREEMLDELVMWYGVYLATIPSGMVSFDFDRCHRIKEAILSVLASTPERGPVSCVVCGRWGRTIDMPRTCGDCLPQDARGEGEG